MIKTTTPAERINVKIAKYQAAKELLNTPDGDEYYDERIAILEAVRSVE